MTKEEKLKAIESFKKSYDKTYGEGSFRTLSSDSYREVPKRSTGLLGLDLILSGGFGESRIVEIYGPESSGKTSVVLSAIAEEMKRDSTAQVFYADAENAFDEGYAKTLGVDLNRLVLDQSNGTEDILNKLRDVIRSGLFSYVVLDSVNSISPQTEQDKGMEESTMGVNARLISSFLRQIVGPLGKSECKTTFIIISQIRMKIGGYGNPEVAGVGSSIKFFASQRLEVRKKETNTVGDEAVSNTVKIKCIKSKIGKPFREGLFTIRFGEGFDRGSDILELGLKLGVLESRGAWLYYGEQKWNGKVKFTEYLKTDEKLYEEIKQKIEDTIHGKNINLDDVKVDSSEEVTNQTEEE